MVGRAIVTKVKTEKKGLGVAQYLEVLALEQKLDCNIKNESLDSNQKIENAGCDCTSCSACSALFKFNSKSETKKMNLASFNVFNKSGKEFSVGDTVFYEIGKATIIMQTVLFLLLPICLFFSTFFFLYMYFFSEGVAILISFLVLALSISFFVVLSKTCFKRFFMPYI